MDVAKDLTPPWTLTGSAALVGFHLHHRTTRVLDLSVYGRSTLEGYAAQVTATLGSAGMEARSQQSGSVMHRLLVTSGGETTVVDLVADPVANIDVLGQVAGGFGYADLIARSGAMTVAGREVQVLELGALIEIKEKLGREKDLAQLPVLRRTLKERGN
ncbi:MAG: hypothetical protein ACI8Y8_003433 [Planctomycetota bacterium]